MELTRDYKTRVVEALRAAQQNYGGTLKGFCQKIGINQASYSRLLNGELDGVVSNNEFIRIGYQLDVSIKKDTWKIARTSVYHEIENSMNFSKKYNKAFILIDDPGIGKTECAKNVAKGMKNAFYINCSEAKTVQLFTRELARIVGVNNTGRFIDVKRDLKYTLNILEDPIVVLDDAGYLDNKVFVEIIEYWNATEDSCAWYMIGDDALQNKIDRGINTKKPGFKAVFNRFNESFVRLVPIGKDDRQAYLQQLITDVATINLPDASETHKYVKKCITERKVLRTLKTLIQRNA